MISRAKEWLAFILLLVVCNGANASVFTPLGVGGGGAMSSLSFSPYSNLWFVGTDMGILYRSPDAGKHWQALSQTDVSFSSNLRFASQVGFNPDKKTVYWASAGCDPKISHDTGLSWSPLHSLAQLLPQDRNPEPNRPSWACLSRKNLNRIKYWRVVPSDKNDIYAATWESLYHSQDGGQHWTRLLAGEGESLGTFIDQSTSPYTLYHATTNGLYMSPDKGKRFKHLLVEPLTGFAAGRDSHGLTLAVVLHKHVWVSHNHAQFTPTQQAVGDWLRMANNNSQVLYVTGRRQHKNRTGLSIFKSTNGGKSWRQIFTIPEKMATLKPSGVGIDVGWWDGGYRSFAIAPNNADIVGGTGNFFLTLTKDGGKHWLSPYSTAMDEIAKKGLKRGQWQSTGINPVSVFFVRQNPVDPAVAIAGVADIGCMATMNHGKSWHLCRITGLNTVYGVAFDNKHANVVYAVGSTWHDYPQRWYSDIKIKGKGGVFKSNDYGKHWRRLTPNRPPFRTSYLSIAIDHKRNKIYAGTHGSGIVVSSDEGKTWSFINRGLGQYGKKSKDKKGALIFPEITIDPVNGDVYALHAGNRFWDQTSLPFWREAGIYRLKYGESKWHLLRGVILPVNGGSGMLWRYPLSFAVDWSDPQRKTLYLADMTTPGSDKRAGLWKTMNGGKTWQRILQYNHIRQVVINEYDSNRLLVIGFGSRYRDKPLSSSIVFSPDAGASWVSVYPVPPMFNLLDLQVDRLNPKSAYYSTFGAGVFYGPNPFY